MANLKVEIKKDIALRDVLYTMDNVLTTIGNKIGESFNDSATYPAIESNDGLITGGIVSTISKQWAEKMSLSLKGDITGSTSFDGSEATHINNTKVQKLNGTSLSDIFDNDWYVKNATNLGSITAFGILEGSICNIDNSNIFVKESVTENNSTIDILKCKYAKKADALTSTNTITFNGSVNGTLEGFIGDGTEKTCTLDIEVEQYTPTENTIIYVWENDNSELEETTSSTEWQSHLNATVCYKYCINDISVEQYSHIILSPSDNITSKELFEKYKAMNMVPRIEIDSSTSEYKLYIYCYCYDSDSSKNITPNITLVTITKLGEVKQ